MAKDRTITVLCNEYQNTLNYKYFFFNNNYNSFFDLVVL